MPLEPVASVKSKYDLTRSWFHRRDSYPLVAGTNLVDEGQLMIMAGTTVTEAAVAGGLAEEIPLGVALNASILGTTFTATEAFTVPAAAPFTVQLGHTNLATNTYTTFADALCVGMSAGPATRVVAAAAVLNTSITLNVATGVATFDPGEAGRTGFIRYRWNLTVIESREILRQSAIGRGSDGTFEKLIVGRGQNCVIYTTTYDCAAAWELNVQDGGVAEPNSPVLGAGGIWTTWALNNAGTPLGRVISLPTTDDPYLGIEFSVQ